MIKEAIQYIVGLSKPEIKEIGGTYYSDKSLFPVIHNPKADPIVMHTLTSLIDYLKSNVDKIDQEMIIHVESPTKVSLYSSLDEERERESLVTVYAKVPSFDYERYIDHEQFCIALQSKFIADPSTDRAAVLQFAGTVEDGTVAQYSDDGVSQKATVKTGIASKAEAIVPNPVRLRPYRTFIEVEQPVSAFVFRMKSDSGVRCAIFEADGGAWESTAMTNIKAYLEEQLEEFENFVVIS